MKSLTFLVFYTKIVVLKVVILYVRLNLVLEALCNFRSRVQDFLKTSKRGSVKGCCILFAEIKVATTCLTMRILLAINQ